MCEDGGPIRESLIVGCLWTPAGTLAQLTQWAVLAQRRLLRDARPPLTQSAASPGSWKGPGGDGLSSRGLEGPDKGMSGQDGQGVTSVSVRGAQQQNVPRLRLSL